MPVDARRLIRKMRGGAQAHLLEAVDGHFYVVKFSNNPQHRRVLVNEWIASVFLKYLGLPAAEAAIVRVTPEFLAANPDVHIQLGSTRQAAEPGWHFGSRFPGDPARMVVYDFLPDSLLTKVVNLHDFRGMLAVDQWMGNADSRQAVFFRARLKEWLPTHQADPLQVGFVALMIDHGFVLEGHHWRLNDVPLQGVYHRSLVYANVQGLQDFAPWLDRIVHFPEAVVDQAVKQIPPAWMVGDEAELARLLERLMRRRRRVPDLLEACRRVKANPFPEWR